MRREFTLGTRREFFADTARNATLLAALATGTAHTGEGSSIDPLRRKPEPGPPTDPALIGYEQVARLRCPHPEPRRLAMGPQDRLYVCAGNHISCLTCSGHSRLDLTLAEPVRGVAVATDGTLFVGLRGHIEVYDATGRQLTRWGSPDPRTWITGLTITGDLLFVGDAGQRAVLRYDRGGKLEGRLGVRDPDREIPGLSVPSPYLAVAVGQDGLLYVNNFGRHRVEGYTFEGHLARWWGRPSASIDGFCGCCNPVGLAILPDGRFVTCEKGIPRVKVYNPAGEFESVVAGPESFPENARACTSLNDCIHGGLDVAVDSQGQVYILDLVTREILVMRKS